MRRTFACLLALCLAVIARAEGPENLNFEADTSGKPPAAWFVPGPAASAGWAATVRTGIGTREGKCVALSKKAGSQGAAFGNLMQQVDAAPFRGKRVVMTAWLRVKADNPQAGGRAQMWFRVDRDGEKVGFFDNSSENPATSPEWTQHKIIADVDDDAVGIAVGFMAFGATVWIDDLKFDIVGDAVSAKEPPRPLTDQGLINLVAMTKLVGYVRYYHPSDEAAACDWNEFVRAKLPVIEAAENPAALAAELIAAFEPLAPTMTVQTAPFKADFDPASMLAAEDSPTEVTAWFRYGFSDKADHGVYQAQRRTWRRGEPAPQHVAAIGESKTAEIAPGVWVRVPLALYKETAGTLPRAKLSIMPTPDAAFVRPSGDDRTTRLAAVSIAWNVFQHHYPYFDVVDVDWGQGLVHALREAATDANAADFHETLEKLIAKLQDGHGFVGYSGAGRWARLPLAWAFVGDRLVVTEVQSPDGTIHEGDEVLVINGLPLAGAASTSAKRMSASTAQFRRFRMAADLARGEAGEECKLELQRPDGTRYTQSLAYVQGGGVIEPRPEKIAEIRPGIWYVDIDRVNDEDVKASMEKLAAAEGLIFDLRGYPGRLSTIVLAHLTDSTLRSARWCTPYLPRPDRDGITHADGGWPVPPAKPRWTSNAAFIIDGRAISYAETYMGIVEHFKLAAIIGEATAGTNGNVTSFTLPGGYSVGFTGMRVLKHDGSTLHGIGIKPTIPVERTIEGIAAGKDEYLEAAIEHVEKNKNVK